MKKRMLAVILGAAVLVSMAGCGKNTSEASGEKQYTIGISQFAEHGSLDNCREGFLEGLKEEGLEEGKNLVVKINNANADMGTASQIAQSFVSDKMDLICAIATPSAQAAYNAAMDSNIPVIYTAVTNPEGAELADSEKKPVGAVTGTSDQLPVEAQLKMIREILPEAKPSEFSIQQAKPILSTASAVTKNWQESTDLHWRLQELRILPRFLWRQRIC